MCQLPPENDRRPTYRRVPASQKPQVLTFSFFLFPVFSLCPINVRDPLLRWLIQVGTLFACKTPDSPFYYGLSPSMASPSCPSPWPAYFACFCQSTGSDEPATMLDGTGNGVRRQVHRVHWNTEKHIYFLIFICSGQKECKEHWAKRMKRLQPQQQRCINDAVVGEWVPAVCCCIKALSHPLSRGQAKHIVWENFMKKKLNL